MKLGFFFKIFSAFFTVKFIHALGAEEENLQKWVGERMESGQQFTTSPYDATTNDHEEWETFKKKEWWSQMASF